MNRLDEIRDQYFEAIASRLPLQRLLVFTMFAALFVLPTAEKDGGLLIALSKVRIEQLISSDGLIWEAQVSDLVLAGVVAAAIGYVTQWLRARVFRMFVRVRSPDSLMQRLGSSGKDVAPGTDGAQANRERLVTGLQRREAELKRRAAMSEVLFAVAAAPLVFFKYSIDLDFAAGLIATCGGLWLLWATYLYYVGKVLPALVVLAGIDGRTVVFGDSLVDEERVLFGRLEEYRLRKKRR